LITKGGSFNNEGGSIMAVEGAGAFGEKVAKEVFNEEGFTYGRMVCKMKFLNGSTKSRPNLYHQSLH
jgi:hypothetical protein